MENFNKAEIDAKVREGMPFKHRWHNRFHLEMPFGLINDPNGLTYYKDEYHIFYQWNPLGVVHKNKCWAHVKTRDFVRYSMPELSLWPSDEHDKDGCYSGCGTVEKGQLRVAYTCNAKDENGKRTPAQRFGTLQADGTIKKEEIMVPDAAPGYTGHFRDPYLFSRHGKRYFVLGAQREDEKGTVVVYEETADGWQLKGELAHRLGDFGYMWECPNLLRFGDYEALIFCPQGLEAREYDRQNIYQAGYVAGHASLDAMTLLHGKFQELDHGFDFYAPQVFQHEGRNLMLGWMGMPDKDDDYPTAEKGWMYSLTMPRELTLRQGHIYSKPAREMKALRIEETAVSLDSDSTDEVVCGLYDASEVILDISLGEAHRVSLELVYGLEKTVITYDTQEQACTIDRSGMKLGGKGKRKFRLYADGVLSLHLFVDRTAVETFFQHGEEAASFFLFPEKNIQPELRIYSDADMESVSGRVWELDSYKFS